MDASLSEKLKKLQELYASIPPTRCLETSCSNGCCSRLEEARDAEGRFISLPLIYSIEFLNIREYVKARFSRSEAEAFFSYDNKSMLCGFKDMGSPSCRAYPVRPFTCRVFGRRVPPVFFGIEYPPEASERIYCPNLAILDEKKEKEFSDRFPLYWQRLTELSSSASVFSTEQLRSIQAVSDVKDIYITGWKEFCLLSRATPDWLKKNFAAFWKDHGGLL